MNYNDLKSIVGSRKTTFEISTPTASFHVAATQSRSYIQPSFTKQEFNEEKPRFLLVTAVGASGKSALAAKLSADTKLPLLDLGVHPPVADNALTGLLTASFPIDQLSSIFSCLKDGSYGIIIDGIDEGRSKVNEPAFNAFLDDLLKRSDGSTGTSFLLLGRTQALIDCWVYLQERGATVGLASLDPFGLQEAIQYIDAFAEPPTLGQREQYDGTRDLILSKLARAFSGDGSKYMSFIGYPPVLDAIATLLREERNYFKLHEELQEGGANEIEASLLFKVASYILERERLAKVIPDVVRGLLTEFPPSEQARIESIAYSAEEQSARLIAQALKLPCTIDVIPQPHLNAKYEELIAQPLGDHPFLVGGNRDFRNAIFEAVCIGVLIADGKADHAKLVSDYMVGRRGNLYLIQMLNQAAPGCVIGSQMMHVLIGAALEFKSIESQAEITIEPRESTDIETDYLQSRSSIEFDVLIEITSSKSDEVERKFDFRSSVARDDIVDLGPRLSACFIEMPCEVLLSGSEEIELTSPVEISAPRISLNSSALVVKARPKSVEKAVILQAGEVVSSIVSLPVEGGVELTIITDTTNLHYPLIKYAKKAIALPTANGVREKYLKLRRILTHFRSHSRGSMAKLAAKIENERVAGNEVGKPLLARLVRDGVLIPGGKFYFLDPTNVDRFLGVSWTRLREGDVSEKLIAYLQSIP